VGTRWGVVLAVLLAAGAFAAPSATQIPDLPDLPPVPDVPEVPDVPPVPGVPDEPPPPPLPALPGSSSESGSTSDDGGSTTAPSGTSSSASGSRERAGARRSGDSGERTRFDRLPRRYEMLLERILHGRGINANLRRLERALASASPELRARIERMVRREIAALRRGDVTPQDRRRIERLRRVESLFAPAAAAPAPEDMASFFAGAADSGAAADSGVAGASDTPASPTGSGTAAAEVAPGREPKSDAGSMLPNPLPEDLTLGAVILALAVALLVFAGLSFALAATPGGVVPSGRARTFVKSSRSNLAFTGLVALAATMLVLLAAALI
jgi:hypothetical protein